MSAIEEELAFLAQALRAHAEWVKSSGAAGLAACDADWLAQRREQYRSYDGPIFEAESRASSIDADAPQAALSAPQMAATHKTVADPPAQVPSSAQTVPGRERAGAAALAALHAKERTEARPSSSAHAQTAATAQRPKFAAPELSTAPAQPGTWQAQLPALVHSEDVLQRLNVLQNTVRSCTQCSLHSARTQTVFARGSGRSGLCFVGEGPGADEDAQGFPFVGAAGQLLDKMIEAMGFDRDDVYVCNIVKCRPPGNRKPEPAEMAACRPYVIEQLELLQPRVIVALGATAVQGLLGVSMGITRLRGQWRLYGAHTPVMPTFHPAYLLRKPSAKREVWQDLQQVLTQLDLPLPGKR